MNIARLLMYVWPFYNIMHETVKEWQIDEIQLTHFKPIPTDIYMFKLNNKNNRTICEICLKLTIKTPERRHWRRSAVFIVNFEQKRRLGCFFSYTPRKQVS